MTLIRCKKIERRACQMTPAMKNIIHIDLQHQSHHDPYGSLPTQDNLWFYNSMNCWEDYENDCWELICIHRLIKTMRTKTEVDLWGSYDPFFRPKIIVRNKLYVWPYWPQWSLPGESGQWRDSS